MSDVIVRDLTPDLVSDYFQFFDNQAFTDNPEWSGCYCYLHHFPGTYEEWQDSSETSNRDAVQELIRNGQFNGMLAYVDEQPVGWCKADIRAELPDPDSVGPPADTPFGEIGVILCFNVAPDYRGRGIARKLLDAACYTLAQRGASMIEGYPVKDAETSADLWHGPLSLYEDAGFSSVMEDESRVLMRKLL